jgi:bifunctional DNase/RNase
MSRMVEVVIDSVRVSLTNQQRIVVLRDVRSERYLTIWIGPYEAEAITIALQEIELARPQTHDLIKKTLSALNARLLQVEVVSLHEDVYYANLVIEVNGSKIEVDSRPSDAIALAVRAHAPILVAEEVMEAAGIAPEQDMQNRPGEQEEEISPEEAQVEQPASPGSAPETNEDRLSIFEDFLANLDIDSEEGPAPDDDEKPDPDQA